VDEPHAAAGRSPAAPTSTGRIAAAAAGIGLYAVVAATARPLTDPAAVAVLLPGLALFAYGARRTPTTTVRAGRATVVAWLALCLVFLAWELVAYRWGNDAAHPTLSLLADPVLDTYPGRLAGYLLWLGTGAWLVTR
jgi:hypothetical protein